MTWLGHPGEPLARRLGLPHVAAVRRTASTMDEAHALAAAGAPAGSLVLAEEQTAGRGRGGRQWESRPGDGIWMTLIERLTDAEAVSVLSLRLGLHLAPVLERWSDGPVRLKWPNDLFVGGGKLAGVLVEARWREQRLDWVGIGIGVNLRVDPADVGRAALAADDPLLVLEELVPAMRAAAFARGYLSERERAEFAGRDLAAGRALSAPGVGIARGIAPSGELLIETAEGVRPYHAGSLVLSTPEGD